MCIMCYKPKGTIIDEKTLRNMFINNDDGAGFAVIEPDEENPSKPSLNVYKGIFSIEKFLEVYEPYKEQQAILHFRIATHKYINGENCHPWRVNDDLVFVHNGTISNINKNPDISDTGNFANEILAPLAKADADFWQRPEFRWFIKNAIGSTNKLVLMNSKGEFGIFNEKAGEWEDGVWYSNWSFKHSNGRRFTKVYSNNTNNTTEGNFESVSSGESNSAEETLENRMSSAADETTDEDIRTYDLDEVDALLEQEQDKAMAKR